VIPKGTRGQGFKGSSEMLKKYKEQKDMEERQHRTTLGGFTYLMVLFAICDADIISRGFRFK
jgi:hypothetical protein